MADFEMTSFTLISASFFSFVFFTIRHYNAWMIINTSLNKNQGFDNYPDCTKTTN